VDNSPLRGGCAPSCPLNHSPYCDDDGLDGALRSRVGPFSTIKWARFRWSLRCPGCPKWVCFRLSSGPQQFQIWRT